MTGPLRHLHSLFADRSLHRAMPHRYQLWECWFACLVVLPSSTLSARHSVTAIVGRTISRYWHTPLGTGETFIMHSAGLFHSHWRSQSRATPGHGQVFFSLVMRQPIVHTCISRVENSPLVGCRFPSSTSPNNTSQGKSQWAGAD